MSPFLLGTYEYNFEGFRRHLSLGEGMTCDADAGFNVFSTENGPLPRLSSGLAMNRSLYM